MKYFLLISIVFLLLQCKTDTGPPDPMMPVPSERQLAWHDLEFYAFVHFNMNTFSNMEWGFGDEKPDQFNPSSLDCRQWAQVCKEAGMKGIILTAKHHDGFCLWPSAYTEHSVKNSVWKNGKGDVLKELSDACKEFDLKFGVYLSPWDRNHAEYGTPAYITYFRNQLRELLTNYGEVFEVWFDGANGGTGYYGGANEERRVDKINYYDWGNTISIIRELQPNAVVFSDAGPDVRWVGNEHGYAYPTTWSMLMKDSIYGGMPDYNTRYSMGQEDGTHWIPAEADVSIRPGWYYHEYEDHKVKSTAQLLDIYYKSIGQNSSLLLNFPVDKRGLIHENDIKQLKSLTQKIKEDFTTDIAKDKVAMASNERSDTYSASKVVDGDKETYWCTSDEIESASLTIDFGQFTGFNRVILQEYIPLGQRIKSFTIQALTENGWEEIASETTIGYKRILRLPTRSAKSIRINFLEFRACPVISSIEVYNAPKLIVPPVISRNKKGEVQVAVPDPGVSIYYTLDGTAPTAFSSRYARPFIHHEAVRVQAIAIDDEKQSEVSELNLDISSNKWQVLHDDSRANQVIDGDISTWWADESANNQNEIIIDLGEVLNIRGLTYVPMQERWISGLVTNYTILISPDQIFWTEATRGEFSNIMNSPIEQLVLFPTVKGRFINFKSTATTDGKAASFAEVTVLTESSKSIFDTN